MMKATILLVICFAYAFAAPSECLVTGTCVAAGQECTSTQTCQRYIDQYTACTKALNFSSPDYNTENCACLTNALTPLYQREYCRPYYALNTACSFVANCTCPQVPAPRAYTNVGCTQGYYCDYAAGASTPTCLAKKTSGNCTSAAQCGSTDTLLDVSRSYACSFEAAANTTVCKANAYGSDKDQCTVAGDCYSDVCTGGFCVGKASGATCTFSAQCAYGLYCGAAGTCTAQVASGATCNRIYSNQCTLGNVCGGNNVCTPSFSKAVGLTCADGAECTPGNVCTSGKCAAAPASPVGCNTSVTTDCDMYTNGFCTCSGGATASCYIGQQSLRTTADCVTAFNAAVTCLTTNACTEVDFTAGSCGTQKCSKEQNCLFKCYTDVVGGNAACYNWQQPTCDIPGLTGNTSSAALLVVSSLILFVMSLF